MPGRNTRIGGVYATFRARNEQFIAASQQNVAAIRRQRQAARQLQQTGRALNRTFGGIARTFASLGSAAVFGGLTVGLSSLGRSSAQLGANLVETSRQLGVTTEQLQLFGRVAEGDGVALASFENSLRQLNRRLGESALGEGEYVEAFERLGIALTDSAGQTRQTIDVFLEAADAIAALPTQADRAIAAYELFGRQGIALLPILQNGAEALQAQAASFAEFGILTQQQAVTLKALEQSYTDTGTIIRTAIAGITADNAELFDSFNRFARVAAPIVFEGVVSALQTLRENLVIVRATVSLLVAGFLRWIGVFRVLGATMLVVSGGFRALISGAVGFSAALAGIRRALIATGLFALAPLVGEALFQFNRLRLAVGGLVPAFELVGQAALEFGRVLASPLIGTYRVYAELTGRIESIFLQLFRRLLNAARQWAAQFANTIITAVNRALQTIQNSLGRTINLEIPLIPTIDIGTATVEIRRQAQSLSQVYNDAFDVQTPALDRLRELVRGTNNDIATALDNVRQAGASTAIELNRAIEEAANVASASVESTISLSQRLAEGTADAIAGAVTAGISGVESAADAARRIVRNVINDILSSLIRSSVLNLFGGLFGGGGGFGGIFGGFLQQGGPVRAGVPYIVGEAGPEAFVPNQNGRVVPNNELGGQTVVNFSPVIQVQDRRAVDLALAEAFPVFEGRVLRTIQQDARRPSALRQSIRGT